MPPERDHVETDGDQVDWSELTVKKLKIELGSRGLIKGGRKADLVARLVAHDKEEPVETAFIPKPKQTANNHGEPAGCSVSPKRKQAKEASPEPVIEGPLASEVIVNQYINPDTGERRSRDFVAQPDDNFKDKLKRIKNERMFMLNRRKTVDTKGNIREVFDIAGSKGNIYTTTISSKPECDCPDFRFRPAKKCKHIYYALIVILKAPVYLQYQLAFLKEELESIFANAPVTNAPAHGHDHDESIYNGSRKPVDGECPICVFEMAPGEELVWCKAACGQNIHKECFDQWRTSKSGGKLTCVYCRTEWQEDGGNLASLKDSAPKIGNYKNISDHPMYQQPLEE